MLSEDLQKLVKKYKISQSRIEREFISDNSSLSAKALTDSIQQFLTKHNIDDATIEVEIDGDSSAYFEGIYISAELPLSEEELLSQIEALQEREKERKEERKNAKMAKKEQDYKTYVRLAKQFKNVSK